MSPQILDMQLRNRPNIALAVPVEYHAPAKAMMAQMLMMSCCWKPGDYFLTLPKVAATHVTRNAFVTQFLELPESVEFLVMLDSDMVPPANLIDIWVGREDYRFPFISAYCTTKVYPYEPIPSVYHGAVERDGQTVHGYRAITDMEVNSGIQRVDGVGMAAVCIRRDVLEQIEPPYFAWEGGGGEDFYFCRKVQEVKTPDAPDGVWIAIDTHVQVGHVGEFVAYPDHWFQNRAAGVTGIEEEVFDRTAAD